MSSVAWHKRAGRITCERNGRGTHVLGKIEIGMNVSTAEVAGSILLSSFSHPSNILYPSVWLRSCPEALLNDGKACYERTDITEVKSVNENFCLLIRAESSAFDRVCHKSGRLK